MLLNPLHALFPDAPEHASPYSPSSRAWFNMLYLDVEAIADFAECEEARALVLAPQFQAQLRALRAAEQVDYRGVAEVKSQVLEHLYRHFRSDHLTRNTERARAFRAFQAEHGDSLRKQALFEALQEHFARRTARCGAGRRGRKPTATRMRRRWRHSAMPTWSGWSISNTCNGRRPHNWPRPARVRGSWGSAWA